MEQEQTGNGETGNVKFILWALALIAFATPITFIVLGVSLIYVAGDVPVNDIPAPTLPGELIAISSTAVGALGAFLTSARGSSE